MEDLITTVNRQDEKKYTSECYTWNQHFVKHILKTPAMNTSDFLKLDLDKLKQYSRRYFLCGITTK